MCIIIFQEETDGDFQIGSLFNDEEEKAGQSSTATFPSYERKSLKSETGAGVLNQFFKQRRDSIKVHKRAEIMSCSRSSLIRVRSKVFRTRKRIAN